MRTKKYSCELVELDKKNEQGEFTFRRSISALDIMSFGEVTLAFSYEKGKRKPINYIMVYRGIATIIGSCFETVDFVTEKLLNHFGGTDKVNEAVINRYKELKLI